MKRLSTRGELTTLHTLRSKKQSTEKHATSFQPRVYKEHIWEGLTTWVGTGQQVTLAKKCEVLEGGPACRNSLLETIKVSGSLNVSVPPV